MWRLNKLKNCSHSGNGAVTNSLIIHSHTHLLGRGGGQTDGGTGAQVVDYPPNNCLAPDRVLTHRHEVRIYSPCLPTLSNYCCLTVWMIQG